MTKLLLYLILSRYLSVCFSAFQCPSPHYPGATIRLRSSAVSFSTWSVQRSLAGGGYGSEPQKERKRKRRQQLLEPLWLCSSRVDLLSGTGVRGPRGSGLCAAAGTVTLVVHSCHLGHRLTWPRHCCPCALLRCRSHAGSL